MKIFDKTKIRSLKKYFKVNISSKFAFLSQSNVANVIIRLMKKIQIRLTFI